MRLSFIAGLGAGGAVGWLLHFVVGVNVEIAGAVAIPVGFLVGYFVQKVLGV